MSENFTTARWLLFPELEEQILEARLKHLSGPITAASRQELATQLSHMLMEGRVRLQLRCIEAPTPSLTRITPCALVTGKGDQVLVRFLSGGEPVKLEGCASRMEEVGRDYAKAFLASTDGQNLRMAYDMRGWMARDWLRDLPYSKRRLFMTKACLCNHDELTPTMERLFAASFPAGCKAGIREALKPQVVR